MKLKTIVSLCLAAILLLATPALAQGYVAASKLKASPEVYVLDNAGVLTDDTKGEIVFSNDLLNAKCGAQIVVVTLDTTGREAIDDYTNDLFNAWGVGDAKAQNGFLLLLAISDDDYYALCGSGLQPKFTSSALKEYFDRYLETDFAAQRYDAGVKKFFEAVFKRVADTYNANVTVEQGIAAYEASATGTLPSARFGGGSVRSASSDGDSFGFIIGLLFVIVLIMLLVHLSRRRRYARNVYVSAPPPPPPVGMGGYRGPGPSRVARDADMFSRGLLYGLFRSSGGSRPSGGFRSSGSGFRSSGGSSRSFGGGSSRSFGGSSRSFGGGRSSGGGAGRGRH